VIYISAEVTAQNLHRYGKNDYDQRIADARLPGRRRLKRK
jgi:hypothetical protein